MLKTLFEGKGNYKISKHNEMTLYYYFGNCIGVIDNKKKEFELNSCGYIGHSSTTRALNDLQTYYTNKEYKLLKRC